MRMLTQFEVRQRMEAIRQSRTTPFRKARQLLKLGRSLKAQARELRLVRAQTVRASDRAAAAGLGRMASDAAMLREDLRNAAVGLLRRD